MDTGNPALKEEENSDLEAELAETETMIASSKETMITVEEELAMAKEDDDTTGVSEAEATLREITETIASLGSQGEKTPGG